MESKALALSRVITLQMSMESKALALSRVITPQMSMESKALALYNGVQSFSFVTLCHAAEKNVTFCQANLLWL
jgi:hypothetical protein